MYTSDMRRAFHSVIAPKGFKVELIDNEHFLTIKLDEKKIKRITGAQTKQSLLEFIENE
jgi:hypothetical protein